MINSNFIRTLDNFKKFMLSDSVPNYIIRYCKNLNDVKWIWFYSQMIEAVLITDDIEYLFYVLKLILKNDFHDLAYEMYFYDIMNPEYREKSLINDKYWEVYTEYYHQKILDDIC